MPVSTMVSIGEECEGGKTQEGGGKPGITHV
jgi:hypothetical protein